ncbi:outer membrane lipoprotein-sorting protein [candidate division KSB1 bacterium]|nr:outer membrane lipoprotein-sorting protein [candidate division KSB1 bacterium]
MRRISLLTAIFTLVLFAGVEAQELTAVDILKKADAVVNAPKDQKMLSKMILIDKDGWEKVRETEMYQKGDDKRLVRFLSPADQKGIAFLGLPNDVQYLYLPAFKKVRRIASHVKNTKFAGTDFTYDDLSAFKFAEEYDPKLLGTTGECYLLELTPKPDVKKDYGKLKMWVRKDNFYPVKIEYYNKGGRLWKIMERRKLKKQGNYWYTEEMEMKDVKQKHSTKMLVDKMEFDTGLTDKLFTQRYLKRRK